MPSLTAPRVAAPAAAAASQGREAGLGLGREDRAGSLRAGWIGERAGFSTKLVGGAGPGLWRRKEGRGIADADAAKVGM